MMRSLVLSLVVVLGVLISPSAAEALSCSGAQQAFIVSPVAMPLSSDLSLVMSVSNGSPPVMRLVNSDGVRIRLKSELIAPGLHRYHAAASIAPGKWMLSTTKFSKVSYFLGREPIAAAANIAQVTATTPLEIEVKDLSLKTPTRPTIASVEFVRSPYTGLWGPPSVNRLTVRLHEDLAAPFVAIIGKWTNRKSKRRAPTFARVVMPQTAGLARKEIMVYATPVRCSQMPARSAAPKEDDLAEFVLVDVRGTLYPISGSHRLNLARQVNPASALAPARALIESLKKQSIELLAPVWHSVF